MKVTFDKLHKCLAYTMSSSTAKEEFDEVHMQLTQSRADDIETGRSTSDSPQGFPSKLLTITRNIFTPIFVEAFVLTFFAEWGDRSQITTIVLAATKVSDHLDTTS